MIFFLFVYVPCLTSDILLWTRETRCDHNGHVFDVHCKQCWLEWKCSLEAMMEQDWTTTNTPCSTSGFTLSSQKLQQYRGHHQFSRKRKTEKLLKPEASIRQSGWPEYSLHLLAQLFKYNFYTIVGRFEDERNLGDDCWYNKIWYNYPYGYSQSSHLNRTHLQRGWSVVKISLPFFGLFVLLISICKDFNLLIGV